MHNNIVVFVEVTSRTCRLAGVTDQNFPCFLASAGVARKQPYCAYRKVGSSLGDSGFTGPLPISIDRSKQLVGGDAQGFGESGEVFP